CINFIILSISMNRITIPLITREVQSLFWEIDGCSINICFRFRKMLFVRYKYKYIFPYPIKCGTIPAASRGTSGISSKWSANQYPSEQNPPHWYPEKNSGLPDSHPVFGGDIHGIAHLDIEGFVK